MALYSPDKLFGLPTPLIQAPMAGVSTPELAAAVCEAGGLGSLGIGASTVTQARAAIMQTRALTDRPFQVNVFCHEPARRNAVDEQAWIALMVPLFEECGVEAPAQLEEIYRSFVGDDDVLQMLVETRPAFVSFHFGLPSAETVAILKRAGIVTLATATNVVEAAAIEVAGVDGIVAQGAEAGGHRGIFDTEAMDEMLGTADLLQRIAAQTKLPVIAAGGIMDGAGIRDMLLAEAAGVQLGTAFVGCPESSASNAYRGLLQGPQAGNTVFTDVISGRLARGIGNRMAAFVKEAGLQPPAYPVAYDLAKQLHAAAVDKGNHEFGAYWAGAGAGACRMMPAGELVQLLLREMGESN